MATKLLTPCERCGIREAADGHMMCAVCASAPVSGPLPVWIDEWWQANGPAVTARRLEWTEAHATPLVTARNFGELFTDFEVLPRACGADVYDRTGHGPIITPFGQVSRYCSVNVHGRRWALAVLPDRELLDTINRDGLLMRRAAEEDGIHFAIVTDPLEGTRAPNARVYYFYRGLVGQRFVALIKAFTVPERHA